jgi:DNA-binding response OmpR family regulator
MQLGADDYITKPFSLYELLINTRLAKYDTLEQINEKISCSYKSSNIRYLYLSKR